MKKLLIIFVLGLLFCSNGFADVKDVKNVLKKIKSNEDISTGFKNLEIQGKMEKLIIGELRLRQCLNLNQDLVNMFYK